jgi:eukaryotic-like serine/threonine-protein kinase
MGDPKVIGRYEIVEELGRGAMGSVFKARDPAVGRIVALKTIHTTALEGAQSEEYRTRFYREARASGVLAHPGIVPVFDVGDDAGVPFLVMEFVDGRNLADVIKKGERYTLDRVCEIVQQVAEALGYAHRQGVIHRDIKPANILMTSKAVYGSERPRITDFGIAKLASSDITTTGQLLGTPSFMPPEQFTGSPIDGRADLFSLGVILYSLATGEQPFPGETMTAVSYKVVYTEPIPPAKLNPAIPARFEAVILKSLAKSPSDRFQTGEEMAQELAALRTGSGTTISPSANFAPPPVNSDVTLGPGPAGAGAFFPPAQAVTADKTARPGQAPAAKKPSKPFETLFAIGLLSVAGLAAVIAGGWFWLAHRKPPEPPPQQVVTIPAPEPQQNPPQTQPQSQPAGPTTPVPETAPGPTPTKPGAGPEATPTKPVPASGPGASPAGSPKSAKPSAGKPSSAKTTPAPPQPVAVVTPPPAPVAKPVAANPTPAKTQPPAPSAPAAFDPRKADPDKNGKLKIDVSKFPKGLPFTVSMNNKPYIHFITGDGSNLDNLYAPPGMQQFQVSFKSSGQEWDSKPVSSDFKAKKTKTLKVQLLDNGAAESKITLPVSKDAVLSISFSITLSDLF